MWSLYCIMSMSVRLGASTRLVRQAPRASLHIGSDGARPSAEGTSGAEDRRLHRRSAPSALPWALPWALSIASGCSDMTARRDPGVRQSESRSSVVAAAEVTQQGCEAAHGALHGEVRQRPCVGVGLIRMVAESWARAPLRSIWPEKGGGRPWEVSGRPWEVGGRPWKHLAEEGQWKAMEGQWKAVEASCRRKGGDRTWPEKASPQLASRRSAYEACMRSVLSGCGVGSRGSSSASSGWMHTASGAAISGGELAISGAISGGEIAISGDELAISGGELAISGAISGGELAISGGELARDSSAAV